MLNKWRILIFNPNEKERKRKNKRKQKMVGLDLGRYMVVSLRQKKKNTKKNCVKRLPSHPKSPPNHHHQSRCWRGPPGWWCHRDSNGWFAVSRNHPLWWSSFQKPTQHAKHFPRDMSRAILPFPFGIARSEINGPDLMPKVLTLTGLQPFDLYKYHQPLLYYFL